MSAKQIWFGIPGTHMQLVPAPKAGMDASRSGFYVGEVLGNGRKLSYRSKQTHRKFQMDFFGDANDLTGLNVFSKFASGFYDADLLSYGRKYGNLIYLEDPYAAQENVMTPEWASPGLIEQGWRDIYGSDTSITYSATTANSYNQPLRSATWDITTAANAVPAMPYRMVIAIPPDKTLWLGATGSATGTAVLRVRPILTNNSYTTVVDLTLSGQTSATRLTNSFSGATYQAVEVYITRTSSATSTLTLTSTMGQIWKTGITPTATGNHRPGQGHHGLRFADEAIVESYEFITGAQKGLSTTLEEVG